MSKFYLLDISKHNGKCDYAAIKKAGHIGVIIRVGYGVNVVKDSYLDIHYQGAVKAGLAVGFYYYSYALKKGQGTTEAKNCYKLIKNLSHTLPVYIDMEDADGYKAKNGMPSASVLQSICKEFVAYMESKGIPTGVYASKSWFDSSRYLKGLNLPKEQMWIARYGVNDGKKHYDYSARCDLYQFTSEYKLGEKRFDRNIMTRDLRTDAKAATSGSTTPSSYDKYRVKNDRVKEWQKAMNTGFDLTGSKKLAVDGDWYEKCQDFAAEHLLWSGQAHNCPTANKWLQKRLNELGFNGKDGKKLTVDGKIGKNTTYAINKFRKSHGWKEDGKIGRVSVYYLIK